MDFLNFVLAFVEGLGLILSPCILPILPIMLSGSIAGGKKRSLGIMLGFTLIFALFGVFSHLLVTHLNLNLNILRDVAFGLIILFGVVMISDSLTEKFSTLTQSATNLGANFAALNDAAQNGFWGGLLLGALVSLIWTPCAGPLLAAALIQIAIQKTQLANFLALFCFALGSVIPMMLIALLGKKLLSTISFFKKHSLLLRKILGGIIICTALFLGYASYFNPALFVFSPNNSAAPTPKISSVTNPSTTASQLINGLNNPHIAPPLADTGTWINSKPLVLKHLKGKVVLVDFWTYSCVNCIRTLPYLMAWDKIYRKQGLVIIGVHTPEFAFERDLNNVRRAVAQEGIQYPVLLDNQYITWQNYHNHYWPAHYLIDKNGLVVYQHFGEGDYDSTEDNIRTLLGADVMQTTEPVEKNIAPYKASFLETPETYFGYARADHFSSQESMRTNGLKNYTFPQKLSANQWALNGQWVINAEHITSMAANAAIKLNFHAKHVYVVAGSVDKKPIKIRVLINDAPIDHDAGKDVQNGILTVTNQRLYELTNFPDTMSSEITLVIDRPGAVFYTFTFG